MKNSKAVFVDAKQRGIYKFQVKDPQGNVTWEGVCAEPSPDAVSALAATLGVDLSINDKGQFGLSQAISEGVSSIGLRTAAIEALRDIMYRNCEAYALGGVSSMGLETLQRRFQSTMVAILAIEQLTGAVRPPATIIVSNSKAGDADAIVDLTNKTETARKSLVDAKEIEEKAKSEFDSATTKQSDSGKKVGDGKAEYDRIKALATQTDEEKKKVAEYQALLKEDDANKKATEEKKKEYDTAQATTKERDQALKALDASRVAALTGGGSSGNAGEIEKIAPRTALSDAAVKDIALAVTKIVETTVSLNYTSEVCTTLVGQHPEIKPEYGSPTWACTVLLTSQDKSPSAIQQQLFNILSKPE
ncbi:MAG: hypothetical protein VYA55_22830 [Pseudomonadota bacterium]|nr:hypothetical protein [Pseudomonadota bacterium]